MTSSTVFTEPSDDPPSGESGGGSGAPAVDDVAARTGDATSTAKGANDGGADDAGAHDDEADDAVIEAGSQVGAYRVVSLLGEGGMGRVYVAEHAVIGRRVALKVLRAEQVRNKVSIERFFSEARVVNRIKHPGIVEVTDLFIENSRPCIVMELLEGRTLSAEIASLGHVPVDRVVEIGIQVASALAAAHALDVVHRDLKPDNIVLLGDDVGLRVKVLDFGVAKLGLPPVGAGRLFAGRPAGRPVAGRTAAGSIVGTPEYMSPEQLTTRPVDARADVYSLGVVLYEALTGQRPFSGGFGDLVVKHMTVEAPRLVDVPAGLAELVRVSLAKDPAQRPQSMNAVVAALRAVPRAAPGTLDTRPHGVGADDGGGVVVGALAVKRRAVPRIGIAAAVAVVVCGTAVALWSRGQTTTTTTSPTNTASSTAAPESPSPATAAVRATSLPAEAAVPPIAPLLTPERAPPASISKPSTSTTRARVKRGVIDPFAEGG